MLDRRQANQTWAAKDSLKAAGIGLFVAGGGSMGKVHHKLMTIDDQVTIFGSFNYTEPANKSNDENILIVGDADTEDANSQALQKRIAMAAREEIDRIIKDNGEIV